MCTHKQLYRRTGRGERPEKPQEMAETLETSVTKKTALNPWKKKTQQVLPFKNGGILVSLRVQKSKTKTKEGEMGILSSP